MTLSQVVVFRCFFLPLPILQYDEGFLGLAGRVEDGDRRTLVFQCIFTNHFLKNRVVFLLLFFFVTEGFEDDVECLGRAAAVGEEDLRKEDRVIRIILEEDFCDVALGQRPGLYADEVACADEDERQECKREEGDKDKKRPPDIPRQEQKKPHIGKDA